MDNWNRRIEKMLLEVMDALLERFESGRSGGFIDTKLDLMTGRDFGAEDLWYKQQNIIFPWIQGRGLEALAGHIAFVQNTELLSGAEKLDRISRIKRLLKEVSGNANEFPQKITNPTGC